MKKYDNITIYVIPGCPFCQAALGFLDENKIEYQKIIVPDDKSQRKELDQFAQYFPDDVRGVPVIVVTAADGKKYYFNDETDPKFLELVLN